MPLRAALVILLFALCAAAADIPSPNPTQIRKSAAEVTKSYEVQSRLPNDSGNAAASTRRRTDGWSPFGEGFSIPAPAAVLSAMQWALIAVVVVAILALLAIMFREPFESRLRPSISGRPGPALQEAAPSADPREFLARADQLAAAGQFAEAMHCVLLAAMVMLGHGQPRKSADSLTSWELLRSAAVPPAALQALRDLVIRVERAWFGQRPAGPDDYRQVRGSFDAFAASKPPAAETA